jgi:replication fork clamp-binding protein CrfC
MHRERLKEVALVFALAIIFGIMSMYFADQTSAATDTDKTATQKIKEEGTDVARTIQNYTVKQRDEAVRKAKEALADLDTRIDRMESRFDKKWNQMDESAREKARATMHSLRKQRTEVAEWYGSLKHSSAAAWKDVKKGFSKSYENLKATFMKAEREY